MVTEAAHFVEGTKELLEVWFFPQQPTQTTDLGIFSLS
jgi:hypothetical protein